ncbi:amino acid transporter heavy chain SLC3A2-like [Heptranchias perlo]|uniref:amino acid transporter heavy chain SLC3A2-like n=1 Tax=Heptranchias perlo TaxID=212740 RepID=UPI00355AC3AC
MFQKNGHQQVGQSEEKPIHPPRQSTDDLGPFPSDPRPSWAPLSKEEIMMMQDVLFWVWLRVSLLLFLVLVWLGLLAGAVLVTVQSLEPSPILRWWQRSVFYQVEVDVFQDSNGDGIGGLNGVVEGLSYLQALSVNALILCPVYKRDPNVPRPNLTAIADLYSSPDHFTNLVSEAGKHGIKILLDIAGAEGLDLNCTSPPPSQYANNISSTVRSTEQERWSLNTTGCEDVGVRRMCCARDDQAETLEFWLKQGVSGFQIHTSGELQAKEMIDVWRQLIEERLGEERTERVLVLVTDAVYEDLVCHGWAGSETASDVLFRYDPFPITGNLSARDLAETVLKYSVTTQRDWAVGPTVGYLTSVAGDLHGLFTVLMLSLPGVPFINCGDEIGRVELQRPPVMQCSNSIPNMTGRPWLPDFLRPIPAEVRYLKRASVQPTLTLIFFMWIPSQWWRNH